MTRILLVPLVYLVTLTNGFLNTAPKLDVHPNIEDAVDPGSPLLLTPYIEAGNIEEARNLSRVNFPGFPRIESYAGFFTVDKTYNSNQFFWYFPRADVRFRKILIICLQGGPGVSSLFGLFNENGPFEVIDKQFHLRKAYPALIYDMIYIDNPVGTGFSFTNDSRGYCTDMVQVGEHLYTTLIQFYELFPETKELELIIRGEGYAGKYVTALGYTIHKKKSSATIKIDPAKLEIVNGWCDPINQLGYSDYLYHIGLVDWNEQKELEKSQNQVIELIKKEAWTQAYKSYLNLTKTIQSYIGIIDMKNYLHIQTRNWSDYLKLIDRTSIRKAIHVGNLTNNDGGLVKKALAEDIMKSVAPWISELLDHYSVNFHNGQLDIITPYPLIVNFLRNLNFSGSADYLIAMRQYFVIVPSWIHFAYLKESGNISEILYRDAGHMVSRDQPGWMDWLD